MIRIWRFNFIVLTAIIVHAIWGFTLLFSNAPLSCTPMASTPWRHSQYVGAILYLSAAVLALLPSIFKKLDTPMRGLLCCSLQQGLLILSAGSAIYCVAKGQYADLVQRPRLFILDDQAWTIIGMIMHTFALIDWHGRALSNSGVDYAGLESSNLGVDSIVRANADLIYGVHESQAESGIPKDSHES